MFARGAITYTNTLLVNTNTLLMSHMQSAIKWPQYYGLVCKHVQHFPKATFCVKVDCV